MQGFLSTVRAVRGGRVAIAILSAALPGLVFAGSAAGCTCAPVSPAQALSSADAAIVGRLIAIEPKGPARAAYRYRVLRVYRGREEIEPGSTISVLSGVDSAGCALPNRLQRRYGLFLTGNGGGRWASGLCAVIAPPRLYQLTRTPVPSTVSSDGTAGSCFPGWS
jgi:hypothetical protein